MKQDQKLIIPTYEYLTSSYIR